MLTASYRLRSDADFRKVKAKGKLYQSPDFALAVLSKDTNDSSRFGFVVSTKISKSAVVRNKVKRILREAVTKVISEVKAGYDCVFLVKTPILNSNKEDLMKEVERVMKIANIT